MIILHFVAFVIGAYEIRVGYCKDDTNFTSNTMCGDAVTGAEALTNDSVVRACPTDTYGQFVYISNTDGSVLQFCEVNVYGVLGKLN